MSGQRAGRGKGPPVGQIDGDLIEAPSACPGGNHPDRAADAYHRYRAAAAQPAQIWPAGSCGGDVGSNPCCNAYVWSCLVASAGGCFGKPGRHGVTVIGRVPCNHDETKRQFVAASGRPRY